MAEIYFPENLKRSWSNAKKRKKERIRKRKKAADEIRIFCNREMVRFFTVIQNRPIFFV